MAGLQRVDIYVEADNTAPASMQRNGGYVLECKRKNGDLVTKEAFMETEGTYHVTVMQMLISAMERMKQPCQICLHTQDAYVLNMVDKFLSTWAEHGFCNSKGQPVKNADVWEQLWQQVKKHEIVIEHGSHPYYRWMQEQMKKMREEKAAQL